MPFGKLTIFMPFGNSFEIYAVWEFFEIYAIWDVNAENSATNSISEKDCFHKWQAKQNFSAFANFFWIISKKKLKQIILSITQMKQSIKWYAHLPKCRSSNKIFFVEDKLNKEPL